MRKTAQFMTLIVATILIGFLWGGIEVTAQPVNGLRADVSLMDDYGNLLVDYHSEIFRVENEEFFYSEPPEINGYVFVTVNVLRLEIDNGVSFRVNYFYTQDDVPPGALPEPVALEQMPTKRTEVKQKDVWVSWTDESKKELLDSEKMVFNHYWETFEIPEPKSLRGYSFQRLETGVKKNDGEKIPHFIYIYNKDNESETPPSLIFEHMVDNRSVRTIRREITPQPPVTKPEAEPETKPEAGPETKPEAEPETKSETKPETEPETKPQTKTDLKPSPTSQTKSDTVPSTKPVRDSLSKPGLSAQTKTGSVVTPSTRVNTKTNSSQGMEESSNHDEVLFTGYRLPFLLLGGLLVAAFIIFKNIQRKR